MSSYSDRITSKKDYYIVIILNCNDGIIPYPEGMKDENREIHLFAERRLLYTAMTRAREQLYILTSGKPSYRAGVQIPHDEKS